MLKVKIIFIVLIVALLKGILATKTANLSVFFFFCIGKPMSDKTNITLGVTCTTGIEFSSTIIAYPKPVFEMQYETGITTTQMMIYITRNAVNNFTVRFRQTVIEQSSFGLYYLRMSNIFGESTVIVHVIEQSK